MRDIDVLLLQIRLLLVTGLLGIGKEIIMTRRRFRKEQHELTYDIKYNVQLKRYEN